MSTLPNFDKYPDGLVPVIIQHAHTLQVLMLGYMNQDAYNQTIKSNKVTFFSRSRNTLWTKGETSGNYLIYNEILLDCDADTLLIKATPSGPTCHTGAFSCFENKPETHFLHALEHIIQNRRNHPNDASYTASLFKKGLPKIVQKVGEEAVETVIEAMRNEPEKFLDEVSDLLYHTLVLLAAKGVSLHQIEANLYARNKPE